MSEYIGCSTDMEGEPHRWFDAQPKHARHAVLQVHGTAGGFVLCNGRQYLWLDTGFGYSPSLEFEKTH